MSAKEVTLSLEEAEDVLRLYRKVSGPGDSCRKFGLDSWDALYHLEALVREARKPEPSPFEMQLHGEWDGEGDYVPPLQVGQRVLLYRDGTLIDTRVGRHEGFAPDVYEFTNGMVLDLSLDWRVAVVPS